MKKIQKVKFVYPESNPISPSDRLVNGQYTTRVM